ncbi:MAG: TAXI family TRAP transporter solute-binding subunit [Hyphomicrobiales bacterium]|jgi:TRAP transporter TAXI family solute receptor|nr:TAXI family TRAP transporter solute-binding subunit [Hyphomicrobiales bacterium]
MRRGQRVACGLAGAAACALLVIGALTASARPSAAQDMTYLSLGTGAVNGVYFPAGRAICRLFNRTAAPLTARCGVESTPGSVYNMTKLRQSELEFAMVQSDTASDAFAGRGPFAGRPEPSLRSVASLHPELITIVARAGSGIGSLDDLRLKRLNTGVLGSGSRTTWSALEDAAGWSVVDRPVLSELKPDVALTALCNDQLDAVLLLVGHPSAVVRRSLDACDTRIVPVAGAAIDRLAAAVPHFQTGTIPATAYGLPAELPSFGVRAVLVTTAGMGDDIVYAMTRAILRNIDDLRHSHPALAGLTPQQMMKDAIVAPLHPGALRAYRELGLTN